MPRELHHQMPGRLKGYRPAGEVRKPGQTVRDKDLIAVGRGLQNAEHELIEAARAAAAMHGHHLVIQALRCQGRIGIEFLAWLQGREFAGQCEVAEAAALPRGQYGGGGGEGIPVPSSALVGQGVEDLLRAIMDDSRVLDAFSEWLTFTRGGV